MSWNYGGGRQSSRIVGNFLRERNQGQIKDQRVRRKHLETRKSFSGVQNNLKFGLNFRGVTNLPSLKRISSRDSENYKDSRSYNKIFLVRCYYNPIFKSFQNFFHKILEFRTFGEIHTQQGFSQNRAFSKHGTTIRQDALKRMTWQGLTESTQK